jgi:DNA repair exonuclease SbcCD ATPase subunit
MIVTSMGQEIEHSQKEYDELLQGRQEEMDRVLRELEEQHSKKCEALKSKLRNLKESKQTVLGELKRNALEVSRKETGVTRFQAIINYYNHEEHRATDMRTMAGRWSILPMCQGTLPGVAPATDLTFSNDVNEHPSRRR